MNQDETASCPCCGRAAKIRDQKLNEKMACFLVSLVRLQLRSPGAKTIHAVLGLPEGTRTKTSSDASYLVHWGLIERPGKGLYTARSEGVDFVYGRSVVPSHISLYANDLVIRWSRSLVTIREALGDQVGELASLGRVS